MAGLFGSSARLRDKSLADPQPYVQAGYVDPNPTRTYEQALQQAGVTDPLAALGFPRVDVAPVATDAPAPFQPGANVILGGAAATPSDPQSIAPAFNGLSAAQAAPFAPSHIKPHAFDNGGIGWTLLGAIGDGLSQMGGYGAPFATARARQQQAEQEQAIWSRRHSLERQEAIEDERRKRNAPRYFSGKEDQLSYDPTTGKVATIYDAPTDAETYARSMGYQPGTPEYRGALTDYVLRAYGPTAAGVRSDLLDQRLEGQVNLEGVRQGNRVALRSMPTYAQTRPRGNGYGHRGGAVQGPPRTTGNVYAPILAKMARGEPLTSGEQSVIGMYGRGNRGGGGKAAGVQTATDPKTGRKVAWNGSAWVPAN